MLLKFFCRNPLRAGLARFPQTEERAILAQSQIPARQRNRWWLTLAIVPMLGVVAAFGIAPGSVTENIDRKVVLEDIHLPAESRPAELSVEPKFYREERIQRGDTLGSILTRLAIDDPEAVEQLRTSAESRAFYQLRSGNTVKAVTTDDGTLLSLRYLTSDGQELHAGRVAVDRIAVSLRPLTLQSRPEMSSARIRSSLFQATDDAGLDDEIAIQLAEIFSGEIDFHRDLQAGDRFSVVYETLHHGNEFIRTGRVLAAEFENGGRKLRAILYTDASGRSAYFTEDGKSLRKTFLRSPLEFSRITSGYSSSRYHPVLETWRAHHGVDYGAPQGTRVRATADGVVKLAGQMRGYGNVVILRHPNGYESLYGHLSAFGKGLRSGRRISQSDVVGFVGMTGLASGPHLHYELRIGGVHQNPLKVATPPAPGISPEGRMTFTDAIRSSMNRLDLIRGIDIASNQ